MDQRSRSARSEDHRAHVKAQIERADDLVRRAGVATAEHIRRAEVERAGNSVGAELLEAIETYIAASRTQLAALQRLHRSILRFAEATPDTTRWQRWHMRRNLARAVALMEDGVTGLEEDL
jgi:hypothetical protein